MARCAKVAIKAAAGPPGELTAGEAVNPGRHLGRSDVGVNLGGGQALMCALMTKRRLNHRQRRAAGQARGKRVPESVRRTADVKVSPLPVALDEVTE